MNEDEALAALLRLRASMGDLENALPDSERCIRSAPYTETPADIGRGTI